MQTSQDVPPLRWSSVIDPDEPGALPPGTHPIHITLHAGETVRVVCMNIVHELLTALHSYICLQVGGIT
jgi:hypothetical protein